MCMMGAEAILGLGISAMSGMAQMSVKQQEYQQQVQAYQQNVTNAEKADRDNQNAITLRQEQEDQLSGQKAQSQVIQGAIKRSQISATSAGANVQGMAVDNLTADVNRTVAQNLGVLRTNAFNTAAQLQSQKDASVDQDQSRINSMAIPVAPDPTGTMLGIAGDGLKSFSKLDSSTSGKPLSGFGTGLNLSMG